MKPGKVPPRCKGRYPNGEQCSWPTGHPPHPDCTPPLPVKTRVATGDSAKLQLDELLANAFDED